ncbi:uncharacterized protein LOC110944617 isoform X1 [Helianthus annuus]|uniref:uncharacterized protein LOC110944617 isoform X1 n=1 Tax=Helianthus annuus TaxID=4232 RepID=UPI001652F97C|nr:uncharacterized protein LOC110944617 isoform X1 [Helianthus annuus]XP_035830405.1 uncharacterized protein LOC110944617 isoform X1 [Helianthus annuus]XP_035830406.1 uncharacterized protein LOC110944617 isoform X1 [Helianthus annuus]XP_035830407.1 uncharacterized protein LOC110944617 isoform X1 [Helianthus annuus]XP_035830408.1 uncharacterized protein LOC110944617 isoform X1 [Helianthus annuus]
MGWEHLVLFSCFKRRDCLQKRRLWCHWFEIWVIEYITRSHTYAIFIDEFPKSAWLVSKIGRLTVGVQFDPKFEKKEDARYRNLKNWNYAIRYGLGTGSPLSPSFNFGLELAQNLQFIVSFYQHVVVQRRVKNPLEDNEVVGITNYIDFGFEVQTRIDDEKTSNDIHDSTFRVAASWQANKNILVKTKAGPLGSSFCLAFKSWWKPSFTFSMSGSYCFISSFIRRPMLQSSSSSPWRKMTMVTKNQDR